CAISARPVINLLVTTSVELHPHSPQWAKMARAEIACLHEALGGVIVTVHHIGSTSIPGIMAKPIIDLLPVVSDLDSLDRSMPRVRSCGYDCLGEFGLPGRRYCRRNDPITGKGALDYNDTKNDWIKRIEQDALQWWKAGRLGPDV